jgi:hypothetical protein
MDGAQRSLDECVRIGATGRCAGQFSQLDDMTFEFDLWGRRGHIEALTSIALTSISADEAADKETSESAIRAAGDDIATPAVAFTPTMVSLQEAKLVGDRSTCSCRSRTRPGKPRSRS